MQSYDNMRGYFENTLADSITNRKTSVRPEHPRHLAPHADEGDRVSRNARLRRQPAVVAGRALRLVSAHFDGYTDHVLCIVDLKDVHQAGDRVALVLPGMHPRAARHRRSPRAAASLCIT